MIIETIFFNCLTLEVLQRNLELVNNECKPINSLQFLQSADGF